LRKKSSGPGNSKYWKGGKRQIIGSVFLEDFATDETDFPPSAETQGGRRQQRKEKLMGFEFLKNLCLSADCLVGLAGLSKLDEEETGRGEHPMEVSL
jgi:hypothetical protein